MTPKHCTPVLLFLSFILACCMAGCGKPRIDLAVASQPNVNPDNSGRPSPIMVKMYELRGDLAFKQNDFYSLFHEPAKALGTDLVAADELLFVPSEAKTVSYEPMPETKFVGIVAGFRQIERAQWRAIVPVDPEGKNTVRIELTDASLLLINDTGWEPEKNLRTREQQAQAEESHDRQEPETADPRQPPADDSFPSTTQGADAAGQNLPEQERPGYVLPHSKRTP